MYARGTAVPLLSMHDCDGLCAFVPSSKGKQGKARKTPKANVQNGIPEPIERTKVRVKEGHAKSMQIARET